MESDDLLEFHDKESLEDLLFEEGIESGVPTRLPFSRCPDSDHLVDCVVPILPRRVIANRLVELRTATLSYIELLKPFFCFALFLLSQNQEIFFKSPGMEKRRLNLG